MAKRVRKRSWGGRGDGEGVAREDGWRWFSMLHPASSTTPGRPLSYFPPTPTTSSSIPFIARVAILDALRRARESRIAAGKLNWISRWISNRTNSLPANHPLNLLCLVGVPRPLRFSLAPGAFLRSPIGTIDSFRVIYLLAFEIEIEVDITSNRRR